VKHQPEDVMLSLIQGNKGNKLSHKNGLAIAMMLWCKGSRWFSGTFQASSNEDNEVLKALQQDQKLQN